MLRAPKVQVIIVAGFGGFCGQWWDVEVVPLPAFVFQSVD